MRKLIIIILLLISSFFISGIKKVSIENINMSLSSNELGIVFININDNNGLLLSLNNKNILYILKYNNYNDILNYLKPININIDYIVMNNDYDILGNKILYKDYLYLNNIVFNNKDYIMINYNDISLCINPIYNNCDYVYYTDKTNYQGNCYMWQMCSDGKVPGITDNTVDIDIYYKNKKN